MASEVVKFYKGLEVRPGGRPGTGEEARAKLEEAVLNKLADLNDIEVPQSKVDNEVNGKVLELYQQLRYDSLTTGNPHFFMHQEVEEQMEEIRADAYRQVKTEMLLQRIIEQEQLEVTQAELEAEARAMARRQQIPVERVFDFFGNDLSLLRGDLLIRKAIDLICDSAIIL